METYLEIIQIIFSAVNDSSRLEGSDFIPKLFLLESDIL
jgi:hypothetical protein